MCSSVLPVPAQSMPFEAPSCVGPESVYPSAMRGTVVLFHALDVNWSARMSEVRVADHTYCTEHRKLRSVRCGVGFAASQAIIVNGYSPLLLIVEARIQLEFGSAAIRLFAASNQSRACRARPYERPIAPAPRQWAAVAGSCPPADIFEELTKASVDARSSSRARASRFSASAGPRAAEQPAWNPNLRCPNSSERGLRPCL